MPEIETDLFQLVVMALLVILLLALLLVLNNLTKLAKSLDEAVSRSATSGAEPVGRQDTPAPGWDTGPGGSSQQQSYTPAQTAYEPVPQQAQQATSPQPQVQEQQPVATAAPAAQAAIPEEQPFERDGRWWFKRGDELLIYDEQQGQWQPAPSGSLGQETGASAVATEFQSLGDAGPAPAASGSESGWKCPSCGAVNGATAASCRMCFAQRP